jgi:hypothetical protein
MILPGSAAKLLVQNAIKGTQTKKQQTGAKQTEIDHGTLFCLFGTTETTITSTTVTSSTPRLLA